MAAIKAGILGATGAVGQRFVEALANHPWFEITALAASERSAGKTYKEAAGWRLDTAMPESVENIEVVPVDPKAVDADVVFSALPADLALTVEPEFAKAGFAVASNASSHRMEKDIPLVIPEVNSEHLRLIEVQQDARGWDGYIITNPNCSTIVMTLTLKPLMQFGLETVQVATMQAISGAGFSGVAAMAIYDNVIPYIGSEEKKMETETLKLLGEFNGSEIIPADISVSASCHRVPVVDGHTEAIWAGMRDKPAPEEVREAFLRFDPKLGELPSEPERPLIVRDEVDRPQPRLDRNMGKGMSVSVGRIREGIRYIAMGHNTIRGAAGASVLNAELLHSMGKL
ncbi:MAG: aspartate-semialdehyde dehydrogenase [Methanosarcina thermophila]|jgi:aspartate-semialdehyde dehydrogenase|uniref:aspartate-semialdehyde dehydrogenase n=3 Tax=Methanosarcina thermophila TaxID=2210 RepID=A0A1I6YQC4_METTE|nr:aspartate-semialdehyde dehydrogenase [Methanosarcina thermophila]ALK05150.1 MAG: aspartate-semialdehyde dehydrogenase [Methanosarcina sp. 795]AKB13908.1 Aspartate-semialdehyde dehydrogenase [Methanosarcina thermophila TM-1]AKB15451.1 Aspartate-semialdehyde dehydrogenase [Methanosarcina thermophila CHTI-55]NLU56322.1 aspartate-semialdehyde dehydrogenase [Methanosarcina thermophila]SFT52625.1 aspartate semialdehyde dehydrogenase [Methanosarcina thermophila]